MKVIHKLLIYTILIIVIFGCSNTKKNTIFDNNEKFIVEENKSFEIIEIQYDKSYFVFTPGSLDDGFTYTYGEVNGIYHPVEDYYEVTSPKGEPCNYYVGEDRQQLCAKENIEDAKTLKQKYKEFLKEINISEKELIENMKKY